MVDYWLQQRLPPASVKDFVLQQVIPGFELGRNDFVAALRLADDEGKTFFQVIEAWAESFHQDVLMRAKSKKPNLSHQLSQAYQDFLHDNFDDSESSPQMGAFVERVRRNKDAFLADAKRRIQLETAKMLDDKTVRFDVTIACLTEIDSILSEYVGLFERGLSTAQEQLEALSDEIEHILNLIREKENNWFFRRIKFRKTVRQVMEMIETAMTNRTRLLLFKAAIDICKDLKELIGSEERFESLDGSMRIMRSGLIKELRRLQDILNELKANLRRKFEYFDVDTKDVIHINLYRRGMFEAYYSIDGLPVMERLPELESEFFGSTQTTGVFGIRDVIDKSGVSAFEAELVRFCESKFAQLKKTEAIKEFFAQHLDVAARSAIIQRFISMGSGWLQQDSYFVGLENTHKSRAYVGMAHQSHSDYDSFKEEIIRQFPARVDFLETDESTVYLYTEVAGIPLMHIDNLDQYKRVYLDYSENPDSALHIDKEHYKFRDVLPAKDSVEVANIIEATRTLIIGSILGVIRIIHDDDGSFSYRYESSRSGMMLVRRLGKERMAVEKIKADENLRIELRYKIHSTTSSLSLEDHATIYTLLNFYANEVFPEAYHQIGSDVVSKISPEHRAVIDAMKEEETHLLSQMSQEELFELVTDLSEGLDDFTNPVGRSNRIILVGTTLREKLENFINPYIAGLPLTEENMFFGREYVFRFIKNNLYNASKASVIVLHGQRRTGKTSILYQLIHHLKEDYVPVLIDMQGITEQGMDGFLWAVSYKIFQALKDREILIDRPIYEAFKNHPGFYFREEFLAVVNEKIANRRLLLMFDEFEVLEDRVKSGKLDREIFPYLRNLMQHGQNVDFIFSGTHKLEEMASDYWSILFNIALYKKISFLDRRIARQLIVEPVKDVINYDGAAVEKVLRVTSAHPYFTQLLCHYLVNYCRRRRKALITVQDIDNVIMDVVEAGQAHLDYIWDESSDDEKFTLSILAQEINREGDAVRTSEIEKFLRDNHIKISHENAMLAIKNLAARDIIGEEKRALYYAFKVDLVRRWLRKYKTWEHVIEEVGEVSTND